MNLSFDCHYQYSDGFVLSGKFDATSPCTVLFGPSGSGKTTVLSLIAGILKPGSGRISCGDRQLVNTKEKVWLPPERRDIGYVFQDPLLFPHLSVRENLRYGTRFRKTPSKSVRVEFDVDTIAEILGISELLNRRPAGLSGGEQQRVALGRALASRPELLLMDEPVTSLDETLKWKVLTHLRTAIAEFQLPLIYVTHSQHEAEFLSGDMVRFEGGSIVADVSGN